MILQRKLALFLIAASLSVGSAFSQTFEAERVLIASTLDENGDPVLKAFRVDFEHGLTEVWRTLGGEPGWRNHIDAPIIADIDQDGQNELLGVDRHRVLMWKTPDPEPLIYEIGNEPELGFSALAVGDLDNDGGMEVVAGLGNRLVVLRYEEGFKKVAEYGCCSIGVLLPVDVN